MNAQQIVNNLQEKYQTLEIEYFPRKSRITVYGFHTLEPAVTCKSELESLGFQVGPNSATLTVEAEEEEVTPLSSADEATMEYWSR